MNNFKAGETVKHFKRELLTAEELETEPNKYLYKIIGTALHTETEEELIIYRAEYGEKMLFARPKNMFLSKVDKEKYPNVTQEMRFQKI